MPDWTPAMIELFDRLAEAKTRYGDIAEQMSLELDIELTRNAVIGYAHRRGLSLAQRQSYKRPAQPLTPREPAAPVLHHSLLDLRRDECHWPLGEGPPFMFCRAPVPEASRHRYCAKHESVAYIRARK